MIKRADIDDVITRKNERNRVLDELEKWSWDFGMAYGMLSSFPILKLQEKIKQMRPE
jgi:hypothetical protein